DIAEPGRVGVVETAVDVEGRRALSERAADPQDEEAPLVVGEHVGIHEVAGTGDHRECGAERLTGGIVELCDETAVTRTQSHQAAVGAAFTVVSGPGDLVDS